MQESIQVMLVALGAVSFGVLIDNLGSGSVIFSTAGMIFIMGSFLLGISAFVIFMRDRLLEYGG